jgi:hypothetical protein
LFYYVPVHLTNMATVDEEDDDEREENKDIFISDSENDVQK